ncbi:Ctr copper transporter [Delphinella strobiligena]|nr:Ctr copper transporter [Delphinella strobiligena]
MSMSMVFTTDHSTPLYSNGWTPTTSGAYAGTCIFVAVLAIIARCLQAWRHTLEVNWQEKKLNPRWLSVSNKDAASEGASSASSEPQEKSDEAVLSVRGIGGKVRGGKGGLGRKRCGNSIPWRLSVDLPRACIFTVQAGVGYLLMLAVMTLNIGYFLSVLAGLFFGELVLGRYTASDDGLH